MAVMVRTVLADPHDVMWSIRYNKVTMITSIYYYYTSGNSLVMRLTLLGLLLGLSRGVSICT
jgi:hypothetical protein